MNNATAQQLIDELVADIGSVISNDPAKTTCVWWRGHLSGVVDTVRAVTEAGGIDLQRADAALEALLEAENTRETE